jgi:hypothetical protein
VYCSQFRIVYCVCWSVSQSVNLWVSLSVCQSVSLFWVCRFSQRADRKHPNNRPNSKFLNDSELEIFQNPRKSRFVERALTVTYLISPSTFVRECPITLTRSKMIHLQFYWAKTWVPFFQTRRSTDLKKFPEQKMSVECRSFYIHLLERFPHSEVWSQSIRSKVPGTVDGCDEPSTVVCRSDEIEIQQFHLTKCELNGHIGGNGTFEFTRPLSSNKTCGFQHQEKVLSSIEDLDQSSVVIKILTGYSTLSVLTRGHPTPAALRQSFSKTNRDNRRKSFLSYLWSFGWHRSLRMPNQS